MHVIISQDFKKVEASLSNSKLHMKENKRLYKREKKNSKKNKISLTKTPIPVNIKW